MAAILSLESAPSIDAHPLTQIRIQRDSSSIRPWKYFILNRVTGELLESDRDFHDPRTCSAAAKSAALFYHRRLVAAASATAPTPSTIRPHY